MWNPQGKWVGTVATLLTVFSIHPLPYFNTESWKHVVLDLLAVHISLYYFQVSSIYLCFHILFGILWPLNTGHIIQ